MKRSKGSECVRFSPPLPASRNLRPTEGIASNNSTATPASASTSAAIRPAGPPPMTATASPISMARHAEGEGERQVDHAAVQRALQRLDAARADAQRER